MRTVPLEPRHAYVPAEVERTGESAIVGELARHFLELREITSGDRAARVLRKLYALHNAEPAALWVALRLLSGDLSEITRSYSDIGKEATRSKQAVQQELERVLRALNLHWPKLAQAIVQLRIIKAEWAEPTTPQNDTHRKVRKSPNHRPRA